MDPETAAERGAELAETIKAELGEGWTKLPGLEGTEKKLLFHGERVSLAVGGYLFYVLEGTGRLGLTFQATEDRLETGHFHRGKFVVDRIDPAGDPSLN